MAGKKKTQRTSAAGSRKAVRPRAPRAARRGGEEDASPLTGQRFLAAQLADSALTRRQRRSPITRQELEARVRKGDVRPKLEPEQLLKAINHVKQAAAVPVARLPQDVRGTLATLAGRHRSLHGAKASLAWFPRRRVFSLCADKFGYMAPPRIRNATRLPFDASTQNLLDRLGDLMGDPTRDTGADSIIPAGFTYLGQFVDHDITLDISSSLDTATDATTINNMRTPALDLDSLYGEGPALQPYLYAFPSAGPGTAIKLQLGINIPLGQGGPAGSVGTAGGMQQQTDFDVPRMGASNTAIIGDPRNDENLIVTQFHHAMLRFHNAVVDVLVLGGFTGDIFVEAKKIVTHHYQWAVVNDYLKRICGTTAVDSALATVSAPVASHFRMPVEFAVAAYRFGHSMVREDYWVNFNFPNASLAQVFQFSRNPNIPVLSNWVVDFNAFFDTGIPVPVHNKARPIDSVLAPGLETLPGFTGLMAVLAKRNLRRGLALGLPSGQGMARFFGVPPLTEALLKQGLPANEIAVLDAKRGRLRRKTPLWYYVLREAAVRFGGNQLGPVGGRIVAETFVRMLKRDAGSYLNVVSAFTPTLPSAVPGDFTFADLVTFAGVTQP